MPYLFTSMKVAVAISLVGAIVGELPTGAVAGLGARLLAGSYYGQTVQIWSALFAAAAIAAVLVMHRRVRATASCSGAWGCDAMKPGILIAALVFWLAAWAFNEWLVRLEVRGARSRRRAIGSPCRCSSASPPGAVGRHRARLPVPFVLLPPPLADLGAHRSPRCRRCGPISGRPS